MHDALKEGDTLLISEPRNHFPLVHAQRSLLFAGGIGVTPLLCMAQRLGQIGADFTLHYCTRSPERTAFRDEIAGSPYAGHVQFHHDDGDAAQKLQLEQVLAKPEPRHPPRVCGPTGFIDWVVKTAERLVGQGPGAPGVLRGRAAGHRRRPRLPGQDRQQRRRLRRAADQTIVHALQEHGIEILTSCEQGVRHLHHARAARRVRPPRPLLHRREKGGQARPVHALLLAGEERGASARSLRFELGLPAAHRQPTKKAR
jgi:vanillate O-demethylase ferredoxin subunit